MPKQIPVFTTKQFLRVCRKVGLILNKKSGKGSHIKIIDPKTNNSFPIPKKLPRGLQSALIKKIESWGYDREQIIKLFSISLLVSIKNIFKNLFS